MKSPNAGKYRHWFIQQLKNIIQDLCSFHVFALPSSVCWFTSFHGFKLAATLAARTTCFQIMSKRWRTLPSLEIGFWSKELSAKSLNGLQLERRIGGKWMVFGWEMDKNCYRPQLNHDSITHASMHWACQIKIRTLLHPPLFLLGHHELPY